MALSLLSLEEPVQILLDNIEARKHTIFHDKSGNMLRLPIYTEEDPTISGKIVLDFGKKTVKHLGISIQLIGETRTYHAMDRSIAFLSQRQELAQPGKFKGETSYSFSFSNFDKKYETYYGLAGKTRYYIRVTISKEFETPIKKELDLAVQLPIYEIQLRIADYLMISVELNKVNLHLDECMIGKITIERIYLKIKKIHICIVKREIINPCPGITCTQEELVTKVELTDKCPKKGEIIPFKINLSLFDLSPTLTLCNSKLWMKYILILSLVDEEDRSLFKPIEFNTWRKQ